MENQKKDQFLNDHEKKQSELLEATLKLLERLVCCIDKTNNTITFRGKRRSAFVAFSETVQEDVMENIVTCIEMEGKDRVDVLVTSDYYDDGHLTDYYNKNILGEIALGDMFMIGDNFGVITEMHSEGINYHTVNADGDTIHGQRYIKRTELLEWVDVYAPDN